MAYKQMIVFDMDGVLCDSSSRFRPGKDGKIDLEFWRKSEPTAFFDGLGPKAEWYKSLMANGENYVVIATARVMDWAGRAWLHHKLGYPHHLIARKNQNDFRGGADLKIQGLENLRRLKQFAALPMLVVEDNAKYLEKICQHFKCEGIYVPSNQGF